MKECNFKTKFYNYKKKETDTFVCNENAQKSGLCIYHDEKYDNKDELNKKIKEKIEIALAEKKSLICIGYNIPNVKAEGTFSEPIYFTRANFQNVDFSGSKFNQIDFSGSKFHEADFSKTLFNDAGFLAACF